VINGNCYRARFNGAPITPVFPAGITHSAIATSPDSTVVISMSVTVSPRPRNTFLAARKAAEQVFVIRTKNYELRKCVHKNEPPSVELGLFDSQRVSAKFWHNTHPRRMYVVLEFFSLATLAECCQNTDFGRVRCGFGAILLIE
jgi:hypothetical protein